MVDCRAVGGRIRVEHEGPIGWLVFDQPERRNAISVEMWEEIPRAAARLDADESVRVVVLRGAGEDAFVSGADISEFAGQRTGAAASHYEERNARAFLALASLGKPVIAMIRGWCIGGGVALSLSADLRYASDDAVFAVPAARLGIGYAVGGLETLIRLVGHSAAKEIFFTARRYSAREACDVGLVNRVLPRGELEAFVRDTAERIAQNAPLTVRSVKKIANELAKDPAARDLAGAHASVRRCLESEDYREGMRAFLEKRAPVFRGR
jgi:enoyl-CoA hydratase/carnithine racemase